EKDVVRILGLRIGDRLCHEGFGVVAQRRGARRGGAQDGLCRRLLLRRCFEGADVGTRRGALRLEGGVVPALERAQRRAVLAPLRALQGWSIEKDGRRREQVE